MILPKPFNRLINSTNIIFDTMTYILNQQATIDPWQLLTLSTTDSNGENTNKYPATAPENITVPVGKHIVPLAVWQAQPTLHSRDDIGLWLPNTTEPELLDLDWNHFPVIALDYPKFTDGRSHSIAFLLRNRLGYKNELRAVGDVLVDQLFYMSRVGINAFSLRTDQNIDSALRMLKPFTQTYQGSTDDARPMFRRHQNHGDSRA